MYTVDDPTFLLALLILLFLSIVTVEWCRLDDRRFASEEERLFSGDQKIHSFASNLGSLFSVTYFFGATVIYGHLFGTWLFLAAALALLVSFLIIGRILDAAEALPTAARVGRSNILIDLFRAKLETRDFKMVLGIYLVIYLGLLIEELAVARLLLTSLFPDTPVLTAMVLTIISFLVLLYLYVGGFRAVLKSDVVQLAILAPFLVALLLLMRRSSDVGDLIDFRLDIDLRIAIIALICATFFGIAWFISSVDIFARFNFEVQSSKRVEERRNLLRVTFIALTFLLAIGMAFGSYLEQVVPAITTPLGYFESSTEFFVHNESKWIAVITLLSLYSMIFTTIDALLLNLLHVGWYTEGSRWDRGQLLKILALAAFVSSLLDLNSLGAIGILLGSLLILPAVVLLKILVPSKTGWFPPTLAFLVWGGGISCIVVGVCFQYFRLPFERQLLIPGVVLGSVLTALFAAHGVAGIRWLGARLKGDRDG